MNLYTYNAPPSDYAFCTNWYLKRAEKGTKIADMRKQWGRYAPIVKCCGELFLMAHDGFKTLSGHYAGYPIGENEPYYQK